MRDGILIKNASKSFYTIRETKTGDGGLYTRIESSSSPSTGANIIDSEQKTEICISEQATAINNAGYYKVKLGGKLTLSISSSGGLPPPEFQWRLNGNDIVGATNQNYIVKKISERDDGTYTCLVHNVAGGVLWEEAIVVVSIGDEDDEEL